MDRPFILGVDLDGVCGDYFSSIRSIAAEWLEVPVSTLVKEVDYDFEKWGVNKQAKGFLRLHKFAVTQRDLFRNMKPIERAAQTLWKFSEMGIRIRIITYRLCIKGHHSTAIKQTADWLEHHNFPYWDLCFVRDKGSVNADLYIEDSPSNIKVLQDQGKDVIIFDAPYNRGIAGIRAMNWEAVQNYIELKINKNGNKTIK